MAAGVPPGDYRTHLICYRGIAMQQFQPVFLPQGDKVFRQVGASGSCIREIGFGKFHPLDPIFCIGEGGYDLIPNQGGVSTTMI